MTATGIAAETAPVDARPAPPRRPARSPQADAAVSLDRVYLTFGAVAALADVSLTVRTGEILFLLGPSGSGKSSLLRVVAGLERPDRGTVALDGAVVAGPRGFVEPEARRVGMVFQDYALFPHLTVAANVAFGLRGARRAHDPAVTELLGRLDLTRYASSYPHMLSGGERQRVALARALAPRPRVLLMDEPFSSLDERLRDRVRREILDLLRELGTTTLVVTHDPQEAMRAADRIVLLRGGRVLQSGTAAALYDTPATAFVARFMGEVNDVAAVCRHGRVETPLGTFAAPGFAEGARARVCIRPRYLRVSPTPTGLRGRVLATEFLGETEHVTLAVDGLTTPIALTTFGRARLDTGTTVFLNVDATHVVVVADDDVSGPHSSQGQVT